MPGARCTRGLVCNLRTETRTRDTGTSTRNHARIRHYPCDKEASMERTRKFRQINAVRLIVFTFVSLFFRCLIGVPMGVALDRLLVSVTAE